MNKGIFTRRRASILLLASLCAVFPPSVLQAADFLFTWSASADESIAAYGVYRRTSDSSYEMIDQVPVQDLDDPDHPSYLITGLGNGTSYWFAATAISASGTESDFFNQTCITVNGQIVECTDRDENGTTVFVSCFICAAGEEHGARRPQR